MKVIRVTALPLAALLALAGCSSSSDGAASGVEASYNTAQYDAAAPEGAVDADITDEREVVTTGSLTLVADDASAASDKIITLIERAGGRVDGRSEQAAAEEQHATAWLIVRVPAEELTPTIADIEEFGEVTDVSITSDDVTRQGRDLDARITALETSTERLIDLMTDADSSEALLAAEKALSERQADLEAMRSERDYLSDQVAMSTIQVDIITKRTGEFKTGGFLGGLTSGWHALVTFASAALVALGAALPWLVVLGVPIAVLIVLLRRRRRMQVSGLGQAPRTSADSP